MSYYILYTFCYMIFSINLSLERNSYFYVLQLGIERRVIFLSFESYVQQSHITSMTVGSHPLKVVHATQRRSYYSWNVILNYSFSCFQHIPHSKIKWAVTTLLNALWNIPQTSTFLEFLPSYNCQRKEKKSSYLRTAVTLNWSDEFPSPTKDQKGLTRWGRIRQSRRAYYRFNILFSGIHISLITLNIIW